MKKLLLIVCVAAVVAGGAYWYITRHSFHEFKGIIRMGESQIALHTGMIMIEGKFIRSGEAPTLQLSSEKVKVLYDENTRIYKETSTISSASLSKGLGAKPSVKKETTLVDGVQLTKDVNKLGPGDTVIDAVSSANVYGKNEFRADEIRYYIQIIK
jgi:hypothetical protein